MHMSPCAHNNDIKIVNNETEGASILSLNDEELEISSSDQPSENLK